MSRASDRVGSLSADSRLAEQRRSTHHQSPSHPQQSNAQSLSSATLAQAGNRSSKAGAEFQATPREDDEQHYGASPGDILTTGGSTSSLSSAASSVFSNNLSAYSSNDLRHNMNTLTPLTHTESSPPGKMLSPRSQKRSYEEMHNGTSKSPYLAPGTKSRAVSETLTPVQTPPESNLQARPGPGEITAITRIYDPEGDKSLDSKQRRHMKPTYRTYTVEVRSTSMQLLALT
jgi:histone-lysine N-methyltransferase SETD1